MQIPHIFLAQTRQLWELSTAALKLNIYFSVALQLNLMITSSLLQRRRLARRGWLGLLFDSAAKMRCLHLFSSRVQEQRRIKMIIVMSRQCSTVCWPYLSNPQLWFSWCMNSLHFVIFSLSLARAFNSEKNSTTTRRRLWEFPLSQHKSMSDDDDDNGERMKEFRKTVHDLKYDDISKITADDGNFQD